MGGNYHTKDPSLRRCRRCKLQHLPAEMSDIRLGAGARVRLCKHCWEFFEEMAQLQGKPALALVRDRYDSRRRQLV